MVVIATDANRSVSTWMNNGIDWSLPGSAEDATWVQEHKHYQDVSSICCFPKVKVDLKHGYHLKHPLCGISADWYCQCNSEASYQQHSAHEYRRHIAKLGFVFGLDITEHSILTTSKVKSVHIAVGPVHRLARALFLIS
jgi:hypothetical protein